MSASAPIVATGMRCTHNENCAPLEFSAAPGSITCVIGHDAALRTDYMRALGGLDRPLAGEIYLLGNAMSAVDEKTWLSLRLRAGFVLREAPLVSVLDALRNLTLPALYHRMGTETEMRQKARGLLARLGCEANLRLLPAFLTDAARRQIALARALMLDPEILFLDAPFCGIYGKAADSIHEVLVEWCRAGQRTLMFASDDLEFVRRRADQILVIAGSGPQFFRSWDEFSFSEQSAAFRRPAEWA